MQGTDTNTSPNLWEPESVAEPVKLPESIAEHFREQYAEYIKPEHFQQRLFQQEQLERQRQLTKQQLEQELERQQCLALAKRDSERFWWESKPIIYRRG